MFILLLQSIPGTGTGTGKNIQRIGLTFDKVGNMDADLILHPNNQYYNSQPMQELVKENCLLKEYIKSLEMQLRAFTLQRQALCKQMSTINHQNLQLNRRISAQPTHLASQAALQHYEESFKNQCFKNVTLSKELSIAKAKMEELANNSARKQRIIQEFQAERQKIKEEQKPIIKLTEENKDLVEEKALLLKHKQILAESMKQHKQQIQRLQQENIILSSSLNQARSQVQQLSAQIKQYINNKVHQKWKKNRTENGYGNTHFELNSAFKQLRVQIEAIKHDQLVPPSSKVEEYTYPFKQNAGSEISSPSKWKSIEGKLSLLRSTQSMSRFR